MEPHAGMSVIFVIGAGRSGTTLLADLIGMHPECEKLDEKRYLWMYGAYWRSHDLRGRDEARGGVREYVIGEIERYWNGKNRPRYIVEKTPSNCFRVPFITEAFPTAKFIHIIRDGRAVTASSVRAYYGEKAFALGSGSRRSGKQKLMNIRQRLPEVCRRITERDLPPSGWVPYLVKKTVVLGQMLFSGAPPVWGTRHPGIEEQRKILSMPEVAAIQWREALCRARCDSLVYIPESNRMELRYEDLVENPVGSMRKVLSFLDLPVDTKLERGIRESVRQTGAGTECLAVFDGVCRQQIMCQIEPTLRWLGYLR